MTTVYMKQNDTAPALTATLKDDNGTAIDLTGATVVFNMRQRSDSTVKVNRGSVSIVSAAAGQVSYSWQTGDTDTVGVFDGEFEITHADSTIQTVPSKDYIKVVIKDDLA